MQQFGPIFSPADVASTAVENPEAALGKQVINSAVAAIDAALNPTPEQQAERERAQKQEAEAREQREQRERAEEQQAFQLQQDLQRMRLDAQIIDEAVELDNRPAFVSNAEVIARLDQNVDDGIVGIDAQGVEMAAERQRVLQRLDTSGIEMNVPALDGYAPEVPFGMLANAGVIRLEQVGQEQQQDDRLDMAAAAEARERNIRTLEDGSKLMYARLTYQDGSQVTIDLVFRPADEAREEGKIYALRPETTRRRDEEILTAA